MKQGVGVESDLPALAGRHGGQARGVEGGGGEEGPEGWQGGDVFDEVAKREGVGAGAVGGGGEVGAPGYHFFFSDQTRAPPPLGANANVTQARVLFS